MTPVQMKLLSNDVERVLHAPGNLTGNTLTEMTIILDYVLPVETLQSVSKDIIYTLKHKGPLFQNVRLNVVKWIDDNSMENQVMPLSMLALGRGFEDYGNCEHKAQKRLEILGAKLKTFHARSKLIILISDGNWKVEDENVLREQMQPFLHKKWIWVDENANSKGRIS